MFEEYPFYGLPTTRDWWGNEIVDKDNLTPLQHWLWVSRRMNLYGAPPIPWRGIRTESLPQDLKNQLNPHWSDWVVADPEYARYGRVGEGVLIFVQNKKGMVPARSYNEIELGQKHYVLRPNSPPEPPCNYGGHRRAVAAPVVVPEKVVPYREVPEPEPVQYSRISIENPTRHTCYNGVGDGPFSLLANGTCLNSEQVTLQWNNIGKGPKVPVAINLNDNTWEGRINIPEPGSYWLTARNDKGKYDDTQFEILPETIDVAEILYQPQSNTFFLLNEADYAAFDAAAQEYDVLIQQLENAHNSKSQEQLDAAKAALDSKLKPLVNAGGETSNLTEVIGFRGKKHTYVTSDKIANHWRSYKIDKDIDKKRLFSDQGQLDYNKLKERFTQKKAAANYTWTLVEAQSGALNDWARNINNTAELILCAADEPSRKFDASTQAQVLRYSYGASLKSDFDFKDKTFGIKLGGKADFAVAEGKIGCNTYYPSAEGHNLKFDYTVQNGANSGQVKEFELGFFRLKTEVSAFGFAGASCQASAGVYFEFKDKKMQLRGTNKGDEDFAGGGGEAFAGAKVGGGVTGSGDWKNPEKGHDWDEIIAIGAEGEVSVGVGAEATFKITYYGGKFRLRAKAAIVWGAGGGGSFVFSVDVKTIAEFCTFVYHQLKNNDFNFLDLLSEDAFKYYDTLRSYVLLVDDALEAVYEKGDEFLEEMKDAIKVALDTLENVKTRQQQAEKLAQRILDHPDYALFQPPEGKGRLLRNLCYDYWFSMEETQEDAMIAILKTIQTWNEYKEVMEHLTSDGRRIKPKSATGFDTTWQLGEETLREFLDGLQEGQWQYLKLKLFLNRTQQLPNQPQINLAAVRDNGIATA